MEPSAVEAFFNVTLPPYFHHRHRHRDQSQTQNQHLPQRQPEPTNPAINGLFNIELDPEERRNLYNATEAPYPEIVANMTARLNFWRSQQIPNQNKDPDPNGNAAAEQCRVWVPWLPTFDKCPSTWCSDIASDCGSSTACTGQGRFLCSKTCNSCE